MCGEVEQVLALHLVHVGLGAKRLERREHGPVGAKGAQGSVIADVVQIAVERDREGDPWWRGFDHWSRGNDAVAGGGELGLPDAGLVGGLLGVGARSFAAALALVPPLDEVAAFGMSFVLAVNPDMIGADASLSVKQNRRVPPLAVDLDLLDEIDVRWLLEHGAVRGRTAHRIAHNPANYKKRKAWLVRPAF